MWVYYYWSLSGGKDYGWWTDCHTTDGLYSRLESTNFLLGRVTSAMAPYQHQHFLNRRKKHHWHAWLAKLIRQCWLIDWKLWDHRNKASKEKPTVQQHDILENLRLIARQEFAAGKKGLLPTDYHLIKDRSVVFNYDLPTTQEWVDTIGEARKCFVRTEKKKHDDIDALRKAIRRYLIPAPVPDQL